MSGSSAHSPAGLNCNACRTAGGAGPTLSGSTCVAGVYFATNPAEIPSQMPEYHDTFPEAAPQAHSISDNNEPDPIPAVITAELALIDMLAHVIVDAIQRKTTAPLAKDT